MPPPFVHHAKPCAKLLAVIAYFLLLKVDEAAVAAHNKRTLTSKQSKAKNFITKASTRSEIIAAARKKTANVANVEVLETPPIALGLVGIAWNSPARSSRSAAAAALIRAEVHQRL